MHYDFIIIGGGIVGVSTANAILKKYPDAKLHLLEKENQLALHQTGRNSGVIHSGIYYTPNSFKARFARDGAQKIIDFCTKHGIKYEMCGKLIVATENSELPHLEHLYKRGKQNGLNVTLVGQDEMREIEPHINGIRAIKVEETGIVHFAQITDKIAKIMTDRGGEISLNEQVYNITEKQDHLQIDTLGNSYTTKFLVNCAGLFSDRIARLAGIEPEMKIIPFRGEYFTLVPEKSHLVKNLIYPVPNPEFPFLGVHLTRMINGGIHAGPNAVLAMRREGYKKYDINVKDLFDTLSYPAFWKIAKKHFSYGVEEMIRSVRKKKFLLALQRLIPDIQLNDLITADSGVRAQALDNQGHLLDDFKIISKHRGMHVCNAPSPAATASLSIGNYIANKINI